MKTRLFLAVLLSLALHALALRALRATVTARALPAVRAPVVEIGVLWGPKDAAAGPPAPGGTRGGGARHSRLAGGRAAARARTAPPRGVGTRKPVSASLAAEERPLRETESRSGSGSHGSATREAAVSGSGSRTPSASGAGGGAGAGVASESGPGTPLDLSAILARLRSSAAACATRRHDLAAIAEVRFCVGRDGVPRETSLIASSGDADLDRAALDCVVPRAAPFPPVDRCLVVPLRFQ